MSDKCSAIEGDEVGWPCGVAAQLQARIKELEAKHTDADAPLRREENKPVQSAVGVPDVAPTFQDFREWARKKEGTAIGHMDGQSAAREAWMACSKQAAEALTALQGQLEYMPLKDAKIEEQRSTIKEMRELLAQWVYGWDHMSEYPVGSTRELLERTK